MCKSPVATESMARDPEMARWMEHCAVSEVLQLSRKAHSPAVYLTDVKANVQEQDHRPLLPPPQPSPMYTACEPTHCHDHHHQASPVGQGFHYSETSQT